MKEGGQADFLACRCRCRRAIPGRSKGSKRWEEIGIRWRTRCRLELPCHLQERGGHQRDGTLSTGKRELKSRVWGEEEEKKEKSEERTRPGRFAGSDGYDGRVAALPSARPALKARSATERAPHAQRPNAGARLCAYPPRLVRWHRCSVRVLSGLDLDALYMEGGRSGWTVFHGLCPQELRHLYSSTQNARLMHYDVDGSRHIRQYVQYCTAKHVQAPLSWEQNKWESRQKQQNHPKETPDRIWISQDQMTCHASWHSPKKRFVASCLAQTGMVR